MNNCILLPIEAESQDVALRIFSTLNDRGKPLSDADIFKAQLYKFYVAKNKKVEFVERWKDLEELCNKIFHPKSGTSMDELFTRYMYFERAKKGIKHSTTEALRKFYENDNYLLLRNEKTFENLIILANFWDSVDNQDGQKFSSHILNRLFVLNYAPNVMWTYLVSVYFMKYRDLEGFLDDEKFFIFLNKIIGFIWTYAIVNPGFNSLRTPIFAEMINIIQDKPVTFSGYRFNREDIENVLTNFSFSNNRPITKSMLAWWTFQKETQKLLEKNVTLDIEHIYPRNRWNKEKKSNKEINLESLGNKSLLERRINIRASDYKFDDKKRYYLGQIENRSQQLQEESKIAELVSLAKLKSDFTEDDIAERENNIIRSFIDFLETNELLS